MKYFTTISPILFASTPPLVVQIYYVDEKSVIKGSNLSMKLLYETKRTNEENNDDLLISIPFLNGGTT